MKVEILFPKQCNLFGDLSNMTYLRKCLPQAVFQETDMDQELGFVTQDTDFIYLGPMTERTQEKVIEKLRPHLARIRQLIENGTVFLVTGNALEVFGEYIEDENGRKIQALELFPIYAKRDMMHRHNSVFLGSFRGSHVMGFKTQFTMNYPKDESHGFIQVEKGIGMNKKSRLEGYRENNFFGTYVTGPILVLNPPFTKYLLELLGAPETLAFEQEVTAAYQKMEADFIRQG